MKYAVLFFALAFWSQLFAQSSEINEVTSFSDNFYLGIASSYYIDFVTTPLSFCSLKVGTDPVQDPNDSNNTIFVPRYADAPFQTSYISYFSFGIEPRYNIKEFSDNLVFAVSAPVTFGFGQAFSANDYVKGGTGFGSVQLPILAKLYLGSASTYQSNQDFGLSVGGGLEVNKIGLINPGGTEAERAATKAWVMPSISGAVHFWRGSSPMEVNVKYGFGKKESYNYDSYGNLLTTGRRTTQASSIKLTFIYLMNY